MLLVSGCSLIELAISEGKTLPEVWQNTLTNDQSEGIPSNHGFFKTPDLIVAPIQSQITFNFSLNAMDIRTGGQVWSSEQFELSSNIVGDNKYMYFTNNSGVHKVNLENGEIELINNSIRQGELLFSEGHLFITVNDRSDEFSYVYEIDGSTGLTELILKKSVGTSSRSSLKGLQTHINDNGDLLLIYYENGASQGQSIIAYNYKQRFEVYRFIESFGGANTLKVSNGKVYFNVQPRLNCLDANTGEKIWIKESSLKGPSILYVADGVLGRKREDGEFGLDILEAETGDIKWKSENFQISEYHESLLYFQNSNKVFVTNSQTGSKVVTIKLPLAKNMGGSDYYDNSFVIVPEQELIISTDGHTMYAFKWR